MRYQLVRGHRSIFPLVPSGSPDWILRGASGEGFSTPVDASRLVNPGASRNRILRKFSSFWCWTTVKHLDLLSGKAVSMAPASDNSFTASRGPTKCTNETFGSCSSDLISNKADAVDEGTGIIVNSRLVASRVSWALTAIGTLESDILKGLVGLNVCQRLRTCNESLRRASLPMMETLIFPALRINLCACNVLLLQQDSLLRRDLLGNPRSKRATHEIVVWTRIDRW